jgi:hypothetical protein
MTLREILNILSRKEASDIAGYGRSSAWHWYQKGIKQKVPDFQALIAWADHLQLNDAELGELVRDAQRTRVKVMEQLAQEDKMHIRKRSVLRRDLAKEILAVEQKKSEDRSADEQEELAEEVKEKEEYLQREEAERARLDRLQQYKNRLNKLRSKTNGDH